MMWLAFLVGLSVRPIGGWLLNRIVDWFTPEFDRWQADQHRHT